MIHPFVLLKSLISGSMRAKLFSFLLFVLSSWSFSESMVINNSQRELSLSSTYKSLEVFPLKCHEKKAAVGSNEVEIVDVFDDGFTKSERRVDSLKYFSSIQGSRKESERRIGLLVLFTVPLAWGTYAPVVRYLYDFELPIPGFVFSAIYYSIAALALNIISMSQKQQRTVLHTLSGVNGDVSEYDGEEYDSLGSGRKSKALFNIVEGGFELGLYLFLGNCFQVVGLETVRADRAAFLVQLTTVFVPILQTFFESIDDSTNKKSRLSIGTWLACLIAFIGVFIMGFDEKDFSPQILIDTDMTWFSYINGLRAVVPNLFSSGISHGDILVLFSAVCYTFHVVRLNKYAGKTTPIQLASSKATVEACLSTTLVVLLYFIPKFSMDTPLFLSSLSNEVVTFVDAVYARGFAISPSIITSPALFACFWTGLVTCAYTIYAQSFGQKRVANPTYANLIYSSQPLFSSFFAWWLLNEKLGIFGCIGGLLIGAAVTMIVLDDKENDISLKENVGQDLPLEQY